MSAAIYSVLFICTGNSARSILAEGLLNNVRGERFRAFPAGSHPTGAVHPLALATLRQLHIPTDGYRSKSWDEFSAPGAPSLDFVFTVCDKAAGETCPLWSGHPVTAHWGVPDPASVAGTHEHRAKVFYEAALMLKRRIDLMLSLLLDSLARMFLQRELDQIGRS